jgi:peptidyl-prolyl cis-trans isomerase SurA
MSDLRERPALRKRGQPRQQYAATSLASQPASRASAGERRSQADTRLHQLPALGSREEGRLIRRNQPLGRIFTGKVLAATLLLSALSVAGCKRGVAPAGLDVWAVVNGDQIHRAEAEKYYKSRLNPQAPTPSQEEALSLTLNVLDELINNEILIERAKKLGLEATDGEVEDKFMEFKNPYTEDEFQRQLKDRGVTTNDLKDDIRRQLSVQKLLNREVVAKISITDQDISDFYNQNRAQFNVAETQYRVAQILVTPRKDPQLHNRKNDDATTDVEARRKAAALVQQLANGADFVQLAMDYSEDPATASSGGDLGYVPESSLNQSDPALKSAVVRLKVGEVSPIIPLKDGYHILKLMAREAPGQRQLSDPQVQQSIRDTLRSRKEQLLRAAYMAEARDGAKVINYLAQQVIESNGKLPEIPKFGSSALPPGPASSAPGSTLTPVPASIPAPGNTPAPSHP